MTTQYSPNLQLSLMGPGDQIGNWGNINNTNLGTLLEQAISGGVSFSCTGGTDSLGSMTPGVSATTRNMYITLTGTGGGTVTCPTNNKLYFIYNSTASAITFKTVSGTGISVPAGATYALYCNGTNVVNAISSNSASSSTSANPTATIGLTAVNGTATTFMTSDSAPALSQAIVPTWTGAHIWSASTTFNGTSVFGGSATFNAAFSTTSTAGFSGAVTFTSTTNPTMNDGAGTQYAVGFRAIPQNSQTTNYTTVLADSGKHILMNGTSLTVTIAANASVAYPIGTVLTFVNSNSSSLTIAINSDTLTRAGTTTTGSRTLAQNGMATAVKVGATSWIINGAGIS